MQETGNYNVLDSVISTCKIITNYGEVLDFKYMLLELNYYEDIFTNFITGNIAVNDSVNYISLLQFNGTETITISFTNPSREDVIQRQFRVYKISDRTLVSPTNENYILHFCSEELLLSEQIRISKSYNKLEISNIIKSICLDYLKIPTERISWIEPTVGTRDIIIPSYKPFQALNWLASLALSELTISGGTTFLFYENKDGFNFESLHALFQQKVYRTFLYEVKNVNSDINNKDPDTNRKYNSVISYEQLNSFDQLSNAHTGTFNNKVITFDPLRGKFSEKIFDYKTFAKDLPTLNSNSFQTDNMNRLGKSTDDTTSVYRYVISTTGQSENKYIKNKNLNIQENRVENIAPYRITLLTILNSNKLRLMIPGDIGMTIGVVIEFLLPSLSKGTLEQEFDPFYSGKYIVTAVRHIIKQSSNFVTVIEVCKDSFTTPRVSVDNTSTFNKFLK